MTAPFQARRFRPPAGVDTESAAVLEAMGKALPRMKPTTDEVDFIGNNELRACWVGQALWDYAILANRGGRHVDDIVRTMRTEELETVVRDFLNDLRHFGDAVGIDIDEAFAYSVHYEADIRGEI